LGAKLQASGLRLTWAYSPDALKVLVSSDGVNFAEAAGWQSNTRSDVSFTHFVSFARPTSVRAVTVLMRGPRNWGFFGISSAALLADMGPSMLVSGSTSAQSGCVVRDASEDQVFLAPCLDAIATGLGKEIFIAKESGGTGTTFESTTSLGQCLASASPIGGGQLVLKACDAVGAEGRFSFTVSGQLKLPGLGNYCVTVSGTVLSTEDCDEVGKSSDAGDKFFLVAASPVDTNIGSVASDVAILATASADRLSASNEALSSALQSCSLIGNENLSLIQKNRGSVESYFAELIAETRKIIAVARRS